jgi:hypothetical protein
LRTLQVDAGDAVVASPGGEAKIELVQASAQILYRGWRCHRASHGDAQDRLEIAVEGPVAQTRHLQLARFLDRGVAAMNWP